MEKLNKIIEAMAKANFTSDIRSKSYMDFIVNNAQLGEFVRYFTTKKTNANKVWSEVYGDTYLCNMHGLAESFIWDVMWVRLKDKYFESAVKSLEEKVEASFKITIEQL